MIRSLWIAKTGLDSQQTSLDVITNNLANAQTTAFKRLRPVFSELLYQNLRANGLAQGEDRGNPGAGGVPMPPGASATGYIAIPAGLSIGAGAQVIATQRINSQGQVVRTDNPLDLAIKGLGYFRVSTSTAPSPNNFAYTRAGTFMRDNAGNIVTANGHYLLDDADNLINVPADADSIVVAEDGTVTYYQGDPLVPIFAGKVGLYTFSNPAGLNNGGSDLYYETQASGVANPGTGGVGGFGSLLQYYTEQSNVNIAEELVGLIAAQRAYEITTRSISASDSLLQKLSTI